VSTVLHFHHRWLPASEPFVWELIRHLPVPGLVVSDRRPENVDRFPFEPLISLRPALDRVPVRFRQQAATLWLGRLCRRHDVRVVHAHHGYEIVRVAGVARRRHLPLVVSLHGHDAFGWVDEHPDAYAGILPEAAAVIVPSQFLVDRALELGAGADRVHVIGSGIDTEAFTPSPVPAAPEVTFVGRFVEKKGLDVLAAAWPRVREAVPGARLRVLGYGPLEHLARSIGAEVVVSPDQDVVRQAIREARVVVSPSRTAAGDVAETLLMVNLEAQSSGRPVVTTDHGGIPEYVRADETALVVPEADPDALAGAVVRVLTDDALATRLGSEGPGWARRFDVREVAGRVAALYEALTEDGSGRGHRGPRGRPERPS
jgi:colanic acid/amylovoran biosynthesis glycosyltransferase